MYIMRGKWGEKKYIHGIKLVLMLTMLQTKLLSKVKGLNSRKYCFFIDCDQMRC